MQQRAITEEDVEHCLTHYDVKSIPAKGNWVYRATLPNGNRIKVVVKARSQDSLLVITTA